MERGRPLVLLVLLAALGGHLLQGTQLSELRARRDILPPPPSQALLTTEAFGDCQARFRLLALEVQNFGDGDGHFTALKDYDYGRLLECSRP